FGWKTEGISYRTPNIFYYDTCSVDTIYSVFQTIKCNYANIESNDTSTLVKSKVYPDFIYSNLLTKLPLSNEQFPVFRITSSKKNFPENSIFQCVTILMKDEEFTANLKLIDASDLFNIKVFNNENWKLEGNDSLIFFNEFKKLTFQNSIDCAICLDKTYQNHDYIIEYYADNMHITYFLCDMPISVFPKKNRKTVSKLINLKNILLTIQDKIIQDVKWRENESED
ncbi:MAG: hypothetical protein Q7V19_05280, partial [Bacteroidales bacterium]|nr:hypothetical protein [Bacteroidales bacterium]